MSVEVPCKLLQPCQGDRANLLAVFLRVILMVQKSRKRYPFLGTIFQKYMPTFYANT